MALVISSSIGAATEDLLETALQVPNRETLAHWHDVLGAEPHVAGSEGDARVIKTIADAFPRHGSGDRSLGILATSSPTGSRKSHDCR